MAQIWKGVVFLGVIFCDDMCLTPETASNASLYTEEPQDHHPHRIRGAMLQYITRDS